MLVFNGKKIADKILLDVKKKIKRGKLKPKLAVISIGQDTASELFIRNKKRAAKETGIGVVHYKFSGDVKEINVLRLIRHLNDNPSVNGLIVQLPLPKKLRTDKIIFAIKPQKDVDGFGGKTFSSPLISAILLALKKSVGKPKGKKIIALVNSDIFGKNLKGELKKEGLKIDCLKKEKNFKIKTADILITVVGRPRLIKGEDVKKGVILIDAGITVLAKNKVVGDADKESVKNKAGFLTPVPGGIGPLTIAFLLKNVYLAAKYENR